MADRQENDQQVAKGNYRKEKMLFQEKGIAAKREVVNIERVEGKTPKQ